MAKVNWYQKVSIQSALIGAVSMLLTSIIVALIPSIFNKKSNTNLKVEDITVIDKISDIDNFWMSLKQGINSNNLNNNITSNEIGLFSLLDIKLSNPSNESITITNAKLHVKSVQKKINPQLQMALPVSWKYNLLFNPNIKDTIYSLALSQVIESKKADRFVIILGNESILEKIYFAEYSCEISLFSGESKLANLGTHLIRVHSPLNMSKRAIADKPLNIPIK